MSAIGPASREEELEHKGKTKSLVKYSKPVYVPKGSKDGKGKPGDPLETVVTNTQDILNSILPPRTYQPEKSNKSYREYVLSTPATKADVIALQKELDNQLQIRRARETGICPIREELYGECFDELIRQITIICSHRGLLLVRVRDEMRMTIQAYQTLYESSLAFGMRFALKGEQNRASWNNQISDLSYAIEDLDKQVEELEQQIADIEETDKRTREEENAKHQNTVNALMQDIETFRKRLETKLLENKG